MPTTFQVFEYLAYIIPGTILLYGILWLSPDLKAPLVDEKIDLGSFGIFVILAFVAGLLVHAIAHYVPEQWVLRPLGLVHRTDALICSDAELRGIAIKKAISDKLHEDMETICKNNDARSKQRVLRQIFAGEQKGGTHHDRVELFEGRYYLLLDLSAVFIILIPVSIILRPAWWRASVPLLLIATLLSLERTSYFDRIYASELIQSFLGF
jgi:hypothetical protein